MPSKLPQILGQGYRGPSLPTSNSDAMEDRPFYDPESQNTSGNLQQRKDTKWWCLKHHVTGWKLVLFNSWLNILLFFIPATFFLHIFIERDRLRVVIFIFCILSLLPLLKLHDLTTRELVARIGGSRTGLLSASMGNIVEAVVAFSALQRCELRVVQTSLIGSILSKLLLVLGLCFFAGGIRFTEQGFDPTANQIHSSLLSISVGAILLPAAYHFTLSGLGGQMSDTQKQTILLMSHSVSIILILIYALYLLFQLWSHTHLYKDTQPKSEEFIATLKIRRSFQKLKEHEPSVGTRSSTTDYPRIPSAFLTPTEPTPMRYETSLDYPTSSHSVLPPTPTIRLVERDRLSSIPLTRYPSAMSSSRSFSGSTLNAGSSLGEEREPEDTTLERRPTWQRTTPQLSWFLTLALLIVDTVAVAIVADWLVESMDGIAPAIRKEWVGLILLPGVSAIAECATAINVSVRDQLTLSVSVAVGSTIQTALFVIPTMVTLAWIMGKPLSLLFDPFESMVLYISVQTMTYVVGDGKSNWLEGVILIGLYAIIAVSFWFYPGSNLASSLAVCAAS